MLETNAASASLNLLSRQMEAFFMSNDTTYSICEKCSGLNRVAFKCLNGKSPICGQCKIALPLHDGVNDLDVSSLETLTRKSPLPVVVDFWAPWCGPCRAFAPTFVQAAEQLRGRVVFAKIDTQAHPNAGQIFGIRGIPTLIAFLNGKEVSRTSGAVTIDEFLSWATQAARIPR